MEVAETLPFPTPGVPSTAGEVQVEPRLLWCVSCDTEQGSACCMNPCSNSCSEERALSLSTALLSFRSSIGTVLQVTKAAVGRTAHCTWDSAGLGELHQLPVVCSALQTLELPRSSPGGHPFSPCTISRQHLSWICAANPSEVFQALPLSFLLVWPQF